MSRGVGEKAAKKLGESEQREASPNAGDAWKEDETTFHHHCF